MEEQKFKYVSQEMQTASFVYEPLPLVGVAGRPFVNMNEFVDLSRFPALAYESDRGIALSKDLRHSYIIGEVCPWQKDEFPGPLEAEVLTQLDRYDPDGIHRKAMAGMTVQQRRRYIYLAFGAVSPWYATLYLREDIFRDDGGYVQQEWTPDAAHFPELVSYIKSLEGPVFKSIGRVLFLISYPGVSTVCHRDHLVKAHRNHGINFYLKGWRPFYVWDGQIEKKHYLEKGCQAYFFNNRDYHGVDAEPGMGYTIRIDGQFTQDVLDRIGLPDGELKLP